MTAKKSIPHTQFAAMLAACEGKQESLATAKVNARQLIMLM